MNDIPILRNGMYYVYDLNRLQKNNYFYYKRLVYLSDNGILYFKYSLQQGKNFFLIQTNNHIFDNTVTRSHYLEEVLTPEAFVQKYICELLNAIIYQ